MPACAPPPSVAAREPLPDPADDPTDDPTDQLGDGDQPPRGGVADLVRHAALESPDKLALVEAGGRALTWAGLEEEVGRVATGLGDAGVVAGYRVLLALGNRLEFVTTYLGVLRAQAVAVPVNPGATVEELARVLEDCGARMVVADPATVGAVREALARRADDAPRVRLVAVATTLRPGERSYDHLRADRPHHVPPLRDPEQLAVLLYTSGTSGLPRAAMLSHRALRANIEQVARVRPAMVRGDDVVLGVLPLFHVYGLNAVLGAVLRQRAQLVLVDRFDAEGTLDLVEDQACSVLPLAPPAFAQWRAQEHLAERLGPVRLVLSGSAPLAAEVAEDFTARTGVPVHQGYGLTEASPVVTSTLCSTQVVPPPPSLGAALPGVELRLVDAGGRPTAAGDPGEVEVRGEHLFSGYWPDGAGGPGPDGWWATGDVGLLDEHGDLVLVDRVKELVIVSGFNVYPGEVEDVVREVPGVAEVAVVGTPDDVTGEAVVVYVVPARGTAAAAGGAGAVEGLVAAVVAHGEARLARFKRPARVEVVERLPLTVTGKVQKGRLRLHERRRASGLVE